MLFYQNRYIYTKSILMQITNPIIPINPKEVLVKDTGALDYKAICIFLAIGFFLDDDTYWTHKKVLKPGTEHTIDDNNKLLKSTSYFKWYYKPRSISFEEALEEFTVLFETIIHEQTADKKVILPLSGGLDSRTQATALKHLNADVFSYSYEFKNGFPETKIAEQIAHKCEFEFKPFQIEKGYLWNKLGKLVTLNKCYSDFTSPRQMNIIDEFEQMGDVFSLGHWGDVLFDSYNLGELTEEKQVEFLISKLCKRGGLALAEHFWNIWDLESDFKSYFRARIMSCLSTIKITDVNAKLRAFKSKYWAPRWTSVNLSVFEHYKPIALPYYDDRMCKFICTVPEKYLKNRQLQIAYIKKRNPELAKISWQDKRPYNLYNHNNPNTQKTYIYRVQNKLSRLFNSVIGKPYVQRNWELQFLGKANRQNLEDILFNSDHSSFLPKESIEHYLHQFYNGNALNNAHAINMLLVLTKFNQTQCNG